MTKILDYIFIDTSVLQQESFFHEGHSVTKLLNLAEQGYIRVLLPIITEKEWLKHFKEKTDPNLKINETRRKLSLLGGGEKTEDFLKELEALIDNYDHIREAETIFSEKINNKGIIRIDYSQFESTLKDVFEKYFKQEKPFGSNGKSKEFPDAFVLASLEKYARDNGIDHVVVFSSDNDMNEYKSDVLKINKIGKYLDDLWVHRIPEVNKEQQQKDIDRLFFYIQSEKPAFKKALEEKVEEYLYDPDIYSSYFMYAEIEDVEDIDISLVITAKDMEILSIDDSYIEAVIFPEIDGTANVLHFCEEESIWDSEEKEWFYEKYETSEVEISSYLRVYVKMDRDELEMGQEPHVEIIEVDFQPLQDSLDDCY
ncbi:MAG: PIN domain-containing protein [Bacteroidales bacterium]|nr:PIN domain-containing protein [Bacteroidales bacterium]